MESAALGMLLSKLRDPHPTVQRYAVRSLFEAVKVDVGSKAAQQALADCMLHASHSLPALDEALLQLCALVEQAEVLTASVFTHLQAALECAPAQAVPSIVKSVGFVCRHLLSGHSPTLLSFQSWELHPFVKAFRSRKEAHLEILQQVLIMLTRDGFLKDLDTLQFLQPYLNYVFLQPLAQSANLVAARELYFGMASAVLLNINLGTTLMKLLTQYTYHFISKTTEEADWKFLALRELVDAIESLVMHAYIEAKVSDFEQIVSDIQRLLVDTCYESKEHGFSSLPGLELLGRIVELQKVLETTLCWRQEILYLAHFLAVADLKEEQIALISLARSVLRKTSQGGMDMLIESTFVFPSALLWVFPTANIVTSSCASLKNKAASLLQDLEELLALFWTQKETDTIIPPLNLCLTASYGQLTDNMTKVLLNLWYSKGHRKTWTPVDSIADWITREDYEPEPWLLRILNVLQSQSKISNPSSRKAWQRSHVMSWICMLVSVLTIHPAQYNDSLKVIAGIAKDDPVNGFSLVPVVLFYIKTWRRKWRGGNAGVLFKLMKVLPSLAVHPMSSSIVAGTVQSLMHLNRRLQGTGIRLLCKTWEIADKVYPHLQVQLDHSQFLRPIRDFELTLSRAACLYDVCKRDADQGVELVLSIQACIESESATLQAFGLQSLSCLCEYDVIDFYTAWDVVGAKFSDLPVNPTLAESLCKFLQNGALDAATYPEMSYLVLQILWKAATLLKNDEFDWWIVRQQALQALASFKADDLIRSFGEVGGRHIQILLSEKNTEVLKACEKLVVKLLCHEFEFRRRGEVSVKHTDNKEAKFFAAIPQLFSTSVKKKNAVIECPAAFLLLECYKEGISPKSQSSAKSMLQAWEVDVEEQFTEMANSLNLQENLILALLNLDLWHSFINAQVTVRESHNSSGIPFSNALFQLMKILCKLAEQAIPRVAENAVLALAVLYQVSQQTFGGPVDSILNFLKSCLTQIHHEYLQWTSAIALGYVVQHCNTADWRLKMDVTTLLLECFRTSDRDVVRGACSLALGFVLLNLFIENEGNLGSEAEGTFYKREVHLLALVSQNLLHFLSNWFPELTEVSGKFTMHTTEFVSSRLESLQTETTTKPFQKENTWTIAGLAMALGSSVIAFERVGDLEAVTHVTKFLIQGIHNLCAKLGKDYFSSLALGSFISLPLCIRSCLRLELLTEDLDGLFLDVKQILSVQKCSKSFPVELRMAACIGSGNLLATLLCMGTYKVLLEDVEGLIESMKSTASDNITSLLSLGGYLGLANALGAGAALMVSSQIYRLHELKAMPEVDAGFKSSYISSPLLFESSCKPIVQDLTQFLLNVSLRGSGDTMSSAWWALALTRRAFVSNNHGNQGIPGYGDAKVPSNRLSSLPKDSSLFLLCSWLMNIGKPTVNLSFPFRTVASVLRCLNAAPRLPHLDWGILLRQVLHKAAFSKDHHDVILHDEVCRECVLFSLAHAHSLPTLQALLDELCDLSQMLSSKTSVSSALMLHMAELGSIFPRSRMEKFFSDCVEATSRASRSQGSYLADASWLLKTSFWKGLYALLLSQLDEPSSIIDKRKLSLGANTCLHLLDSPLKQSEDMPHLVEAWSEASKCMCLLASTEWLLKVFDSEGSEDVASAQKSVFILSQMVAQRIVPSSAFMRPLKWLCNQDASFEPEVLQQLLWIVYALKDAPVEEKQQWLLEAIESASSLKSPTMGVLFFALLVSCWCSYGPLLLIDSHTPIQLLPFTLPLLFSEQSWRSLSKMVVHKWCTLLVTAGEDAVGACARGSPLWYVKQACIKLRSELPLGEQLSLLCSLTSNFQ